MDEVGAIGRAHPSHQHWGSRSGEGLSSSRAGGGVSREPGPVMHPKAPTPLVQTFLWHHQCSKFMRDHQARALSST